MRHLLSTADLTRDDATDLLDEAERFEQALTGREIRKLPTLRGRTVMTVFYENSTRTRVSFEVAGKWICLLYTSPSPRDRQKSRMPSSA